MDEKQFWSIVEAGGREVLTDRERQLAAIRAELVRLSPEEVREFQRCFNEKIARAYRWDLWAAAYLINGGSSDDGFHYFRDWLISRGQGVYEAAVENPDSLAGLTDPARDDNEFEELGYLPLEVYETLTGEEMPPAEFAWPTEPGGQRCDLDEDDELRRRLPRLSEAYLE